MAFFQYKGKSVYYAEYGNGETLIFLHGNTASSKMFELLMPLYAENFRSAFAEPAEGHGRLSTLRWSVRISFAR